METKSEKLAQARKKLLNYQKKQQKSRTETSSPVPGASNAEPNSSRSASSMQSVPIFNHDEKRSPFEWLRPPLNQNQVEDSLSNFASTESNLKNEEQSEILAASSTVSLENGVGVLHHYDESTSEAHSVSTEEFNRINAALSESIAEKEKVSSQLVDLHRHYSEMYSAYNALIATVQVGGSSDMEAQTQLSQLRTAMSVVVEEKTAMQRQLREANDLAKRRLEDLQSLKETINEKTIRNAALEQELKDIKRDCENLNGIIKRQNEELDRNRKEAISLQANLLHVQQDRNDAQERLKLSLTSSEQLQNELDETCKQLRLKELYIRQLGAYSTTTSIKEQDIHNLQSENERLVEELQKSRNEVEQFRREAQVAREHYESYGAQLNQNVLSMSTKLEEAAKEKMFLQNRVQSLEEEVKTYRSQVSTGDQTQHNNDERHFIDGNSAGLIQEKEKEIEILKSELEAANQKAVIAEKISAEHFQQLQEQEKICAQKVSEVEEAKKSLMRLQDEQKEYQQAAQDYGRISTELQNEKATLSRAIAQNRELKEQLVELQDKMIALSTENMESESERLTALHTIEQLNSEIVALKRRNLQELPLGKVPSEVSCEEALKNVADKSFNTDDALVKGFLDKVASNDNENAKDEKISQLILELDEVRAENRRIRQQIEELHRIMEQNAEDENQNNIHVELGQAIERINTLSVENERLNNLNQELQLKANEREMDVAPAQDQGISSNDAVNGNLMECDNKTNMQDSGYSSLLEKPLAWTELEARFAKVMRQNAELSEQNELLEHVILQLQSENDTIGEYVTIYHHQRKLIQERMRARDEAVARLSLEKEQMKQKLNDLQTAVSDLFSSKPSWNKFARCLKQEIVPRSTALRIEGQLRSVSNSTVDDLIDDGMSVASGPSQVLSESINDSHGSRRLEGGVVDENTVIGKTAVADASIAEEAVEIGGEVLEEKILRLITELQDMEQARLHPPCAVNICCRECRGKLITL